jgi:hypothetical protein
MHGVQSRWFDAHVAHRTNILCRLIDRYPFKVYEKNKVVLRTDMTWLVYTFFCLIAWHQIVPVAIV